MGGAEELHWKGCGYRIGAMCAINLPQFALWSKWFTLLLYAKYTHPLWRPPKVLSNHSIKFKIQDLVIYIKSKCSSSWSGDLTNRKDKWSVSHTPNIQWWHRASILGWHSSSKYSHLKQACHWSIITLKTCWAEMLPGLPVLRWEARLDQTTVLLPGNDAHCLLCPCSTLWAPGSALGDMLPCSHTPWLLLKEWSMFLSVVFSACFLIIES